MGIDRAIFIGGCPRSGTTFLGNVLGLHSHCVATPESNFVIDVFNDLQPIADQSADAIRKAIEDHWRYKTWALHADWDRAQAAGDYRALIFELADQYGTKILKKDGRIWVDHNPTNLRDSKRMEEIFPGSKYIHIIRDGRGVAKSIIPLNWGPSAVETAAYWWMAFVSAGVVAEMNFGAHALRVKYEELLLNFEKEVRRICDFCEIQFEKEMLSQERGFVLPGYSDDIHTLVGKAPNTDRIDDWKTYFSDKDIAAFENMGGGLLDQLGYTRVFPHGTPGPGKVYRLMTGIKEATGIVRHALFYRPWKDL